jgi:hypothetical protein
MVRGILLATVGVALVVVSWGPLGNLFSEYRDNSLGVYLALGLPPLVLGIACLIAARRELTRR